MSRRLKWLTGAWVAHRLELYLCPSWRHAPVPLRRLLERLEIEHLRHGGMNNGELFVAYTQFVAANISRRKIGQILDLGISLGLLEVMRQREPIGDLRAPNAYRLTYLPTKSAAPTDEWKRVTGERAVALVEAYNSGERNEVETRRSKAA